MYNPKITIMKKYKSLVLSAICLLCSVSVSAEDFEVDGIYYNITSSTDMTVEVTYRGDYDYSYSNEYSGAVNIPESVTYYGSIYSVTSIGNEAFEDCSGLTSVEIPNSVTSIGESAFEFCSGLTSVVIPNSVTSIEYSAFAGCDGLTSVVIGNSVTSIGEYAFDYCPGLTSVVIPNSVTSIGDGAFRDCSGLTSVVIPNSVTSIGEYAFYECSGLTSVHIDDIAAWCNIDFHTYDANPLYYAKNLYLNGEKVTKLVIPNGVPCIGSYAFYNCSDLTSVEIPNSVTSIWDDAFYGCKNLKTVFNGSGLTFIAGSSGYGYVAYYANMIVNKYAGSVGDFIFTQEEGVYNLYKYLGNDRELLLPENYKDSTYVIGASVFSGKSRLNSVKIPNSVTSIGSEAFRGCSGLTSVVIPNSVTSIGSDAFRGCSGLTSVEIGNSVTSIGSDAFRGCSGLTSVVIPNSVTSIGNEAFMNCSGLTSVVIGNSVTSIGNAAFRDCSSLTSVEIPNSVTSIESSAFSCCFGLTSVVIGRGVTSIGSDAFYNCYNLRLVLNNSHFTFKKDSSDYGYIASYAKVVCNGYEQVDDFIFTEEGGACYLRAYIGDKTELVLPANYNGGNYSIGSSAFEGCSSLTSVVIPNSVTCIEYSAFYDCSGLTSVVIPNGVTYIEGSAFRYCSSLTSVEIPNSVTSIGYSAFAGCSGLNSVVIGNSVTSIGEYAFSSCTSLTKLSCYAKVPPTCGSDVFYGINKETCVLQVPESSLTAYQQADQWKEFFFIEDVLSGIGEVTMGGAVPGMVDVYSTNGMLIKRNAELKNLKHELPAGIYIIGGKKVWVK